MNNEDVKKEAKYLLDKFGRDLAKVKMDFKLAGKHGELRVENKGMKCDNEFRTIMFKNARHKDDECLILEKAHWN